MKKRGINRKGFIFSLFVISIISLVILNFKMNEGFREAERAEAFENRVKQINAFIFDVENDMERAVKVTTRNAIWAWNREIVAMGIYPPGPDPNIEGPGFFSDFFLNMFIDGHNPILPSTQPHMIGTTFTEWRDNISELSKRNFGVDMDIMLKKVNVKQDNPWELNVTVETEIVVKDLSNIIRWTFELTNSYPVSLEGLPDPYYIYNINGLVGLPLTQWNYFNKTPYTSFWINMSSPGDPGYSPSDPTYLSLGPLKDHMQRGLYTHDPNAPSYLMRLMDFKDCTLPLWANECTKAGVESMVNLNDGLIRAYWQGLESISPRDPCVIDRQFNTDTCGSIQGHNIIQMHDKSPPVMVPVLIPDPQVHFYLDDSDLVDYGLTKLNTS